ncbi:MAG: hypothetical protein OHK0012_10500 [Synechococcales cyanobacterium]
MKQQRWMVASLVTAVLVGCTQGDPAALKSADPGMDIASDALTMESAPAAPPVPAPMAQMAERTAGAPAVAEVAPTDTGSTDNGLSTQTPPNQTPQLIKNAELVLLVTSIRETIPQISALMAQYQGDTLSLQETRLNDTASNAYLTLRVPQQRLEPVLEKLVTLGQVQRRAVSAQDVSDQLVDYDARLRNLRRTEESILAILNRSGNITEVLAVTRELSQVRQQIEQLDGQLSRLKNQVAYSRISLELVEERPTVIESPSLGDQLAMTFAEAGESLGRLGLSALKSGIWIVVYSPLVLLPLLGIRWWWRSRMRP